MRTAVIGAGPAGLAAAWSLTEAGATVTVYDASARAGGMLRTETIVGAHVDVGVQLVSSSDTSLFELVRAAGAADLLRTAPGRDALWRKGRPQGITYGSVASMATSGALPMSLKLKMMSRYVPFLKLHAHALDSNEPAAHGGAALDTESIGSWGRRELGDDFVDLLAYPLLAAYYGASPDETSAPVYHSLANAGMEVKLYAAAGGFGAVADAIRTALEARGAHFVMNTAVSAVSVAGDVVTVTSAAGATDFDAAVLAVPPNRAADLVAVDGGAAAALISWLRAVRVRPTFTVAFRMERAHPGDYFGLSFPRGEASGETVAALCVQRNKLSGLVQDGGDALVALPAPAAVPALLEHDDERIASTLLDSLDRAFSGMARRVASAHVYRFDDGYTLFETGHLKRIDAFDHGLLPPRIGLAGGFMCAPSVEGAVRSGHRAAHRVLQAD